MLLLYKKHEKGGSFIMSNKTIRINIDIDDQDVRTLNNALSNLESTLQDLSRTLSDSMQNVKDKVKELNSLEKVTKLSSDAFKTFESIVKLSVAPLYMMDEYLEKLNSKLSIVKVKKDALTSAIKLKNATTWLSVKALGAMKLAMKALPFVGLISLGMSAISVIGRLFSDTTNATDAIEDFGYEAKTSRDRIDTLSERIRNNRQAHEENMRAIRIHDQLTGLMVDRITELTQAQDYYGESGRRLKFWVDQFNEAMGESVLAIDSQTGRLDENSKSMIGSETIRRDIATATDLFNEKSQELNVALEEQAEIMELIEYEDLTVQIKEAEKAVGYYSKAMDESRDANYRSMEAMGVMYSTYRDAIQNYNEAQDALTELQDSYDDLDKKRESAIERVANYEQQMEEHYIKMRNLVADYVEAHGMQYWMLNDTQREIIHEMLERWESYRNYGREMFSELGESTKLFATVTDENGREVQKSYRELDKTADEVMQSMIDNMVANREATATWSDNLDDIAGKTSEEFAQHMREMGIDSAWYVQQMAEGCEEILQIMYEEFQASGEQATENLVTSVGKGAEKMIPVMEQLVDATTETLEDRFNAAGFDEIGKRLPDSLGEGVEEGKGDFIKTLEDLGDESPKAIKKIWVMSSPSKVFKEIGKNAIRGLEGGIDALKNQPKDSLQSLATAMKAIYDTAHSDYQSIGQTMMDGLNAGLLGREHMLMGTARRIASQIRQTINNAINQTSGSTPSFAGTPSTSAPAPAMLSNIDTGYAQKFLHNSYHGFSPAFTNQPPVSSLVRNINHTTTHNSHNANNVTLNMGSTNPEYAFTRTNRYLRNLK